MTSLNLKAVARGATPLVLCAALGLTACGKGQQQQPHAPPPPEVTVVTLKAQAVPLSVSLPGRVTAYRVAEVRPQVSGVILKRMFTEGSDVRAGQQLYQIDPATYEAALNSAKASLLSAEAAAKSAAVLAERYDGLIGANAISKQDYDDAVAADLQAKAQVASAKAAVRSAEINLVYTKVLAPISGRIGRSSVTEGALVTAGQATAMATIQQLDPIYVDVTQPSARMLAIKRELAAGRLSKTSDQYAGVTLALEDGTDYGHDGKLQFAEVSVDETSGSVTMRAEFPNPDGMLLPGMFVKESINEAVHDSALLVPQAAVSRDARGNPMAMVVNAENKVEPRVLKTERSVGASWLVTDGVAAGERVILEGMKAQPGGAVRPVEQGAQPQQASAQGAQAEHAE
jgi:membrane fusion protein (multidrug efflux system)